MDLFKTVSDYIDDNYIIKRAYSIKTISTLNNFYVVEVVHSFDKRMGTYNIHKADLLDYIIDNSNKDIKCNYICKRCFLDFNDDSVYFYYNHGVFYMLNIETNVYDEDEEIVEVLQIASVKDSEDYELVRMIVCSINNLLRKKDNKNLEPVEISYLRISFNYIEDICKLDLKLINYKDLK